MTGQEYEGLTDLDAAVMKLADRMTAAGKDERAHELRSAMACIREAWRGADTYGNLVEALESIADNARGAAEILAELDVDATG